MRDTLLTAFMILTAMLLTGGLVAYATAAEPIPVMDDSSAVAQIPAKADAESFVSQMIDQQHRRAGIATP